MPIYEAVCDNAACSIYERPIEHYYPRFDSPIRKCEACGQDARRVPSNFGIIWTGPITAKYLDRSKEGGQKVDGSHWAWEKESRPGTQGKATRIETFSDQKAYCKRNGMALPSEMGNNYSVAEDGKTVQNSVGLPGCEI